MRFLVDLHVHSAASGDSDADPAEIVERALARGLDGLAFTEHDSYAASDFVDALRARFRGRIAILRGVELSAAEGHCLVFGVDTDALRLGGVPLGEVARAVARAGGAAVAAHPYRGGSGAGDRVRAAAGLAALEGCNGLNMHAMNERAIAAARALGLPWTGGSDAHDPAGVGACVTVFRERVTDANLAALLRAGGFDAVDNRRVSRAPAPRDR